MTSSLYTTQQTPFSTDANSMSWLTRIVLIVALALVALLPRQVRAGTPQELKFSASEIAHYERLLGTLAERAEGETREETVQKLKPALSQLEARIEAVRESREELLKGASHSASHSKALEQEELKNDVFALQEAGREAIGIFIDADTKKSLTTPEVTPKQIKISASEKLGSGLNP